MNEIHESNRRFWNASHPWWKERGDRRGVWDRCHLDPSLALTNPELRILGDVSGKDACVLGSGDNQVVFALAGMGARLTSVDLSEEQLATAKARAGKLGLEVTFIQADVTDLSAIDSEAFDLVYTGGHVSVWVSDLRAYYAEAGRILRPGGMFMVNEYHPARRMWHDGEKPVAEQHRYLDRGPYPYDEDQEHPSFEFHWTVADHIQAVIDGGCTVVAVDEFGEGDEEEDWEPVGLLRLPGALLIVGRK